MVVKNYLYSSSDVQPSRVRHNLFSLFEQPLDKPATDDEERKANGGKPGEKKKAPLSHAEGSMHTVGKR
jgi:hypothetical protein